ncbi:MAG: hypothetical protein L0Z55_01070 [Planctomycetes bacterium]|nr:hypothetical protein [Planctomycetota bacterium]
MPQLERLWNEFKDKGLHIFHVESQGTSEDDLKKFCRAKGMTFPQVMGQGSFSGYEGGSGIPYAFVIGADGKVIWQGREGYHAVITEEMAKVRFPGLGKGSVAKGLEKAAATFAQKNYGKAMADAQKKLEAEKGKSSADAAVVADAEHIIARATAVGERLQKKAENAKAEREYAIAMATYKILEDGFKGQPFGDNAATALDAMKADKEISKEVKALQQLDAMLAQLEKAAADEKKKNLKAFAEKFKGLKAAEKADQMAANL